MKENWEKVKEKYRIGVVIFFCFGMFSFYSPPKYEKNDIKMETLTLKQNPEFIVGGYKGRNYRVELKFENKSTLIINGIDYKYLKNKAFKTSIYKGETLLVGTIGENIVSLKNGDYEYLQFEKAQKHKRKNSEFTLGLTMTGFFFCLIPLLFKKRPEIEYGKNKKMDIPFGLILGIALTIVYFYLSEKIGSNFISGEEFAE